MLTSVVLVVQLVPKHGVLAFAAKRRQQEMSW